MVFGMRRAISPPDDVPDSPPHPVVLPPGFLDPMPLHLQDPYHPQHQQPEPESDPEEEPEEAEPEQEPDYVVASGTDSEPDDGLQPYGDWDAEEVESDGTDDLTDAVVIDPPYPLRYTRELPPFPSYTAPQEQGGARWRYTPRMSVLPVGSAHTLRPSAREHPDYTDPYAAGPSYVRRDMGESSQGVQCPAFAPYHSRGPGETLGEIRYQIAQLQARVAAVDETYGPLISASFMHGIHIKVLEQDRDRLEAVRLAAREAEEDRLRSSADRKRKGPAE